MARNPDAGNPLFTTTPQDQKDVALGKLGLTIVHLRTMDLLRDTPHEPFEHPEALLGSMDVIKTDRLGGLPEPGRQARIPKHPVRRSSTEWFVETRRPHRATGR